MKLKDYLNDKVFFLGFNLILLLMVLCSMLYVNISFVLIFVIACIWVLPLLSYIIIDYIKYKNYFSSIESVLENLDKKYLLPEVVKDSNFIIGDKIKEILQVVSRDMHENIKYYINNEQEYREYIETWVHEIKTPISSTKLIIENNNNEITKKIDTQIDKIENYIEQVLYYSKSDNVEKDYIIKEVSLKEIVTNIIKKNSRDFINKNIKLELNDIENTIYSDKKWVEFILNQIISNSIKYSKTKGAKIQISSQDIDNAVVLIIRDNGVGISEKDINRVFEKGFTGENGRVFGKSTGIGLYLCNKLCNKLGLVLTIDSEINKGTVVRIKFPKSKMF